MNEKIFIEARFTFRIQRAWNNGFVGDIYLVYIKDGCSTMVLFSGWVGRTGWYPGGVRYS